MQGSGTGGGGGNVEDVWGMINASGNALPSRERANKLGFHRTGRFYHNSTFGINGDDNSRKGGQHWYIVIVGPFQVTPSSMTPNQRISLGSYMERCENKAVKIPTKVLDASALQDVFDLNLVDSSSLNVLAVGRRSFIYLLLGTTSSGTQLSDLSPPEDVVTYVVWSEEGRHTSIGSTGGDVQLWGAQSQKLMRAMSGHSGRVGASSWKPSGGFGGETGHGMSSPLAYCLRDLIIHLCGPRSDAPYEMMKRCGFKQEVCHLRWSFYGQSNLVSVGNDSKILLWDVKLHTFPRQAFANHTVAVESIVSSPHRNGLLASDWVDCPIVDDECEDAASVSQRLVYNASMYFSTIIAMIFFVYGASRLSMVTGKGRRTVMIPFATIMKYFMMFACLIGHIDGLGYESVRNDHQDSHEVFIERTSGGLSETSGDVSLNSHVSSGYRHGLTAHEAANVRVSLVYHCSSRSIYHYWSSYI